jgi:NAD(P)-dependent dehydrogenase (short-subunit alcohol dehydrogenase family)
MLGGKVALVSGAGGGIGRAAARLFAHNGASVVIAGRNSESAAETVEMVRAAGGVCHAVQADLTIEEEAERFVSEAVSRFGTVDLAFNNSGRGSVVAAPVDELDSSAWRAPIDVNLTAVFYCMKYQIKAMLASGGGAIVNNASTAGLLGSPGASAYIASKHGVVGLTRAAAIDYARRGIRVNAICPGPIGTEMWDSYVSKAPERAAKAVDALPIGRVGLPAEVAELALFLCSDKAAFITGVAIPIDGGLSAA